MRAFLAIATLAGGLTACSNGSPEAPDPGGPNVVLFVIDTLRADRLGPYGFDGPTTPRLDALAEEAVVFEAAGAPAPWTLPSVASIALSTFPAEHGVVRDGDRIPAGADPLAARLERLGYATASLYRNPYAGKMSGLDRGFDLCRPVEGEIDGELVGEWLDAVPQRPFFLYLHDVGPHDPYAPDARYLAPFGEVAPEDAAEIERLLDEYRDLTRKNGPLLRGKRRRDNSPDQTERMQELAGHASAIEALYGAEVRQADAAVGDVIDELRRRGLWEDTLFVLVSDHGEELGERGGWLHDQSVYEELVHVPLIVHLPSGAHGGARVGGPVSLVDVLPTVLDVLGTPRPEEGCRGRSLLPLVRGEAGSGARVTSQRVNEKKLYTPWALARGQENLVVRDGRWKGIWNVELDAFELYDLERDPGERDDLAEKEPERAQALREVARTYRDELMAGGERTRSTVEVELGEEELRMLRELGYLGDEDG